MWVRLRRHYAQIITSGIQLFLLAVVLHDGGETPATPGAIVLMVLVSLAAWFSATRRSRAIGDTPTSRVASAAQGYIELVGKARAPDGVPLLSPVNGLPCLWYRYEIQRRQGDKWVHEASGESDASFVLDDGSGQCLVDPEGAEMMVSRCDRWSMGERRYKQYTLLANDPLYVLGQFKTLGSVDLQLDMSADMRELLVRWKAQRPQLLARFDLDRDGEISLQEWELARREARRQVARQHREARGHSEASVVQSPPDGRLYLISDLAPEKLARRYRLWSAFHLAFFFGGLAGFAWIAQQRAW